MTSDAFHLDDAARATRNLAPQPVNTDGWEQPVPLDAHGELPGFPIDALPDTLRGWVAAEAEATQTPADLGAFVVLATVAATVQKLLVLDLGRGWQEPLGLYTVTVLPPGSRKSAVFSAATEPLVALEAEESARMRPAIAEAVALREMAEARRKAAIAAAARAKPSDRSAAEAEACSAALALDAVRVPAAPRWIVDDTTPEKLAAVLKEQGGRIALLSPEADGLLGITSGRYSDGSPHLGVLLHGHAGEAIRVDRIGREPEHIKAATMSLGLTVQPSTLPALAPHAGRGLRMPRFRGHPTQPKCAAGDRDVQESTKVVHG